MTNQNSNPAAPRRVLDALIDRLYAAITRGPAINCYPGRSRQRCDLAALTRLGAAPPDVLAALLGPAGRVRIEVPLEPLPPVPPEGVVEEPSLRQRRRDQADRVKTLRLLARIADEAESHERDTGAWTLQLGYPILTFQTKRLDPGRRRQAQVMAPLAFVPLRIEARLGSRPSVTISCAGDGADRLAPNPALRAWLEMETGQTFPDLDEDDEGANPAREIRALAAAVCALLRVGDPPDLDAWPVEPAPERDALPPNPAILPAGVIGLFPLTNQCTLMDMEEMQKAEQWPATVAPFLSLDEGLLAGAAAPQPVEPEAPSPSITALPPAAEEHLVAPADPCQRRAVLAARSAHGLVVHGPPGTGKSQTIVNIIGDGLARGERVLLVCDKRTALDVVKARLDAIGLGPLCAVVHDAARDRTALFKDVRAQLDSLAESPPPDDPARELDRVNAEIDRLGAELRSYYAALGAKDADLGLDFHELAGRWLELEISGAADGAPRAVMPENMSEIPLSHAFAREADLRRTLERAEAARYGSNPWREAHAADLNEFLRRPADDVRRAMAACVESARRAEAARVPDLPPYDLELDPAMQGEARARAAAEFLDLSARHDSALLAALAALPSAEAAAARDELEALAPMRERVGQGAPDRDLALTFESNPWTLADVQAGLAALLDYRVRGGGLLGWLRFGVRARAAAVVRRFNLQWSRPSAERVTAFLEGMRARLHLRQLVQQTAGDDWRRLASRDASLLELLDHIGAILDVITRGDSEDESRSVAPLLRRAVSNREAMRALAAHLARCRAEGAALSDAMNAIHRLQLFTASRVLDFREALFRGQAISPALEQFQSSMANLEQLLRFEHEAAAQSAPLAEALRRLARAGLPPALAWHQLLAALYHSHLKARLEAAPRLLEFDPLRLEQTMKFLRDLLAEKQSLERRRIIAIWSARQRERLLASTGSRLNSDGGDLRRRLLLRGRNASRMRQAVYQGLEVPGGDPLFDIKPVWMASPETVSQIFPLRALFDSVVFDEASQCRLEEGLPVLARGRRVVVAGDTRQLPPTRFFESGVISRDAAPESADDSGRDELFALQQSEMEDLLSAALNIDIEQSWLDVHYRSACAELIQFSNLNFYDGRLQPLPGGPPRREDIPPAIRLLRADGVYHNQQNPTEAAAIVERVREILAAPEPPSIGIVTFNLPQRDLIIDALDEAAEADAEFARRLDAARSLERAGQYEGLFVKNLESVQGDERDIIIIGTTFGPDSNGRFYRRFGPLSMPGGERRLNVIITRARLGVDVMTSIPPSEYRALAAAPVSGQRPTGSWYLMQYLKFIEGVESQSKPLPARSKVTPGADRVGEGPRSRFVAGLAAQMKSSGGRAPHWVFWGNAGFYVDMALHPEVDEVDGKDKNKNWIGVLCDATRYSRAQDRVEWDLFQQGILERAGWRVARLWSPHFFRDPKGSFLSFNSPDCGAQQK